MQKAKYALAAGLSVLLVGRGVNAASEKATHEDDAAHEQSILPEWDPKRAGCGPTGPRPVCQ